jgi:hypothetical protein
MLLLKAVGMALLGILTHVGLFCAYLLGNRS